MAVSKVYVVMENDFPAGVFTTEEAAEAFRKERHRLDRRPHPRAPIYRNIHDFPLLGPQPEPKGDHHSD